MSGEDMGFLYGVAIIVIGIAIGCISTPALGWLTFGVLCLIPVILAYLDGEHKKEEE